MILIIVLIQTIVIYFLSTQKREYRDGNFILTGPEVKQTKIINRIKNDPCYITVLCMSDNTPITFLKGQYRIKGKSNVSVRGNDVYTYSTQQDGLFLSFYEQNTQKDCTTIIEYDLREAQLFHECLPPDKVAYCKIWYERELQTIEQEIYDDYRKGINSSFHTIQYTVYPVTSMRFEIEILPKVVKNTENQSEEAAPAVPAQLPKHPASHQQSGESVNLHLNP